jgi:very-short-patch-repair endonuclease
MADSRAQYLRKNLTGPERKLWSALKRFRKLDFHVRRQVPFGAYTLDFASHRERLVIEVDGAQHETEPYRSHDEERTRILRAQGYRVVRYSNYEVLQNLDGVVRDIYEILQARCRIKFSGALPPPEPSPPNGSEGSTAPQRGR